MKYWLGILTLSGFLISCEKDFHPVKADTTYYNIYGTTQVDSSIQAFIQPYHDSLDKQMKEVIATSAIAMDKAKPESLMGNFIAGLLLEKAKAYNDDTADFSIVNYGGLRIPVLPAGEITKGIIYELMPFDNFLVIMELKGTVVKQVLDYIASDGGWPVAGIRFIIQNEKAADIFVNGQPLKDEVLYHVVISDYLADGGDNLLFLRSEKRKNLGIFIRDMILQYLREQTREGKMITSKLDNRITIHE